LKCKKEDENKEKEGKGGSGGGGAKEVGPGDRMQKKGGR